MLWGRRAASGEPAAAVTAAGASTCLPARRRTELCSKRFSRRTRGIVGRSEAACSNDSKVLGPAPAGGLHLPVAYGEILSPKRNYMPGALFGKTPALDPGPGFPAGGPRESDGWAAPVRGPTRCRK
jgi:hypothetical protein